MRGILSLARKHSASVIEEACALAVVRRVRSSKIVREIVERLEEKADATQTLLSLTQSHELIRSLKDYDLFFERYAFQEKTSSLH